MENVEDNITVRQLTLVDDANKPRAILTCHDATGPTLQLVDKSGCPRLELSLDADGTPHITLFSAKSVVQGSFGLDATMGGAGFTLWSENCRFFKDVGVSNDGVADDQGENLADESPKP